MIMHLGFTSRRSICGLAAAVLLSCSVARSEEPAAEAKSPDLVFLCIGQSNMAGRAVLVEEDKQPLEGVQLLNAEGKWEAATHPLNRYATNRKVLSMQRFSPSGPFATAVRKAFPDKTVGLIVNARGGTKIEQWARDQELYEKSLKRAKDLGQPLAGVVWLQGSGNANDSKYLEKLKLLVANLREDLHSPELPVVVGFVPGDLPVNQQIAQLPKHAAKTAVATNEGTSKFDSAHYDRDSYIKIGERLGRAWVSLVKE